jgi:hypothetical protein
MRRVQRDKQDQNASGQERREGVARLEVLPRSVSFSGLSGACGRWGKLAIFHSEESHLAWPPHNRPSDEALYDIQKDLPDSRCRREGVDQPGNRLSDREGSKTAFTED